MVVEAEDGRKALAVRGIRKLHLHELLLVVATVSHLACGLDPWIWNTGFIGVSSHVRRSKGYGSICDYISYRECAKVRTPVSAFFYSVFLHN